MSAPSTEKSAMERYGLYAYAAGVTAQAAYNSCKTVLNGIGKGVKTISETVDPKAVVIAAVTAAVTAAIIYASPTRAMQTQSFSECAVANFRRPALTLCREYAIQDPLYAMDTANDFKLTQYRRWINGDTVAFRTNDIDTLVAAINSAYSSAGQPVPAGVATALEDDRQRVNRQREIIQFVQKGIGTIASFLS